MINHKIDLYSDKFYEDVHHYAEIEFEEYGIKGVQTTAWTAYELKSDIRDWFREYSPESLVDSERTAHFQDLGKAVLFKLAYG